MDTIKKLVSITLCLLLLFSFSIASVDAITTSAEKAGEYLKDIGIYVGYEDGSLGLHKNITRAEFAALAVRIEGLEYMEEGKRGKTAFKDVDGSHWATGYINITDSNGLVKGFEDKTFRPEEQITYVQTLAVIIRILGYDHKVEGEWPGNYIAKAKDLGLDRDISLKPNASINRGQVAIIINNALKVPITR